MQRRIQTQTQTQWRPLWEFWSQCSYNNSQVSSLFEIIIHSTGSTMLLNTLHNIYRNEPWKNMITLIEETQPQHIWKENLKTNANHTLNVLLYSKSLNMALWAQLTSILLYFHVFLILYFWIEHSILRILSTLHESTTFRDYPWEAATQPLQLQKLETTSSYQERMTKCAFFPPHWWWPSSEERQS